MVVEPGEIYIIAAKNEGSHKIRKDSITSVEGALGSQGRSSQRSERIVKPAWHKVALSSSTLIEENPAVLSVTYRSITAKVKVDVEGTSVGSAA